MRHELYVIHNYKEKSKYEQKIHNYKEKRKYNQ